MSPPPRALVALSALVFAPAGCARPPAASAPEEPRYAASFRVVDLPADAPAPVRLAVQACAGLQNRRLGGSTYVRSGANDATWLEALALAPAQTLSAEEHLAACAAEFPACVRYSYATQQALLPNVLTVAAVLEALPADETLGLACGRTAFDAIEAFADKAAPELATRYVFERHGAQTSGLAMLNPGFDTAAKDPATPALVAPAPSFLVDLIFARRLFTVFLVNGCTEGHPERALLDRIVNAGLWPTPVEVYGYNNSWLVAGGYLHEAHTRCLDSRNMGAIPSEADNLSFFATRRPPAAAAELDRAPPPAPTYDPALTSVAFVVGDGDNIAYVLSSRREWLRRRLAACAGPGAACAPLTWSLSPHLVRLAPDVLRWYFEASRTTGADDFILPPSGHLYAYPTSMEPEDQERFAAATEADARSYGVRSVVHWDFFDSWRLAEAVYLPRYARRDGAIRGVFPVNVPYLLEMFPWWEPERSFKVLEGADGGRTALFRPRSWRGVDDRDPTFFPSPERLAAQLGALPRGTVTWVYMTSDGGLTLENAFERLVPLLPPHVRLVTADAAAELAIASGR